MINKDKIQRLKEFHDEIKYYPHDCAAQLLWRIDEHFERYGTDAYINFLIGKNERRVQLKYKDILTITRLGGKVFIELTTILDEEDNNDEPVELKRLMDIREIYMIEFVTYNKIRVKHDERYEVKDNAK